MTIDLISNAYLSLLKVPHDSHSRLYLQAALCGCRDEIARLSGRSAEEVQGEFETLAAITRR